MDDLTFTARRATATRPEAESDLDTRFRNLVQSPLRAGILRYLSARPEESFDSDQLMQTFGRLRQDVDNCIKELVSFGVGRHFCLGASLARLEARIALNELVARVADYEVDPAGARRVHSVNVRGFESLPTSVTLR